MTTQDKIARRKLSLLELANETSNVSEACRNVSVAGCRGSEPFSPLRPLTVNQKQESRIEPDLRMVEVEFPFSNPDRPLVAVSPG